MDKSIFAKYKKEILDNPDLLKFDYDDLKKYYPFPYHEVIETGEGTREIEEFVSSEDMDLEKW